MDERKNFKIYSLSNYAISKTKCEAMGLMFEGTIDEIVEKLNEDKQYHIWINPDEPCLAFGDFDHTTKERFKDFLDILCSKLHCKIEDVSYTKSKKSETEYSYHWVIPSIETTIKKLKNHFNNYSRYDKFKEDKKR